jgi:hypothetical protein
VRPLIVFLSLAVCARVFAQAELADATAKYLAGMSVAGTPLEARSHEPSWQRHATEMTRAWNQCEVDQLAKIREWAPDFLGEPYTDTGLMYYMFSGPDFLYANAFFPKATTYFLCGLEPVGAIPDVEKIPHGLLDPVLTNLRGSLATSLSWSFFVTKKMKSDMAQKELNGTLPILYVFLARLGSTIESVELVALDREGAFVPEGKGTTPGAKIDFTNTEGEQQTLYYFTSNLSDEGIRNAPGFMKLCEQSGAGVSLVKAASYLMQGAWFSTVRDFLLTHSKVLVQDDSGIPFRFFDRAKWRVRCCGRFVGPIPIFQKYPQPDLGKAFAESNPALLEFGFGYQWRPHRSSLIIATPKEVISDDPGVGAGR